MKNEIQNNIGLCINRKLNNRPVNIIQCCKNIMKFVTNIILKYLYISKYNYFYKKLLGRNMCKPKWLTTRNNKSHK